MNHADTSSRKLVYALLITVAAAGVAGRIAATSRVYEPELSRDESNPADPRSRWPTKRPRPAANDSCGGKARLCRCSADKMSAATATPLTTNLDPNLPCHPIRADNCPIC